MDICHNHRCYWGIIALPHIGDCYYADKETLHDRYMADFKRQRKGIKNG